MSKGSRQRPGTGYAENWERVFWKKPDQHQFGNTQSKADRWMSETMMAEIAGRTATSEAMPSPSDILLTGMMLDRNRCYFEIKPAIEGRVPTPWMVDHMHDFTVDQFYDKSLSEDDLKRIFFERNGVDA